MPANTDDDFGARLRAFRERRGITLEAVAEATKIPRSLLADLERNDLSRWPRGIYRRGFVREYAKTVGLPATATVEEFCERFPESTESETRASPDLHATKHACAEWRLTLAGTPRPTLGTISARLLNAAGGLTMVFTIGTVVSLIGDLPFWPASGLVALIWYPTTVVVYGHAVSLRRLRPSRLFRKRAFVPRPRLSRGSTPRSSSDQAVLPGRIVDTAAEQIHICPPGREPRVESLSLRTPTIH